MTLLHGTAQWGPGPARRRKLHPDLTLMDHGDDLGQILIHLGRQTAYPGLFPRFARFRPTV